MIELETPIIPDNLIIKGGEIFQFFTRGKRYDNNLIWAWVKFKYEDNIIPRDFLFNVDIFSKIRNKEFCDVKFALVKKRKYIHLILVEEDKNELE